MSGTRKAPRMVAITTVTPGRRKGQKPPESWRSRARLPGVGAGRVQQLAAAAGSLDRLTRRRAEAVRVDGERLAQLAARQHLDGDAPARGQSARAQLLGRDNLAGLEALLQRPEVDRLRVGAERLKRHRLLHVRAAQLAHPHVDRVLAALKARAALGAGACAPALLAATGGLAGARPLAAAHALARMAGAGRRTQVVQADPLGCRLVGDGRLRRAHRSLTSTRWRTLWIMPRSCGVSSR